MSSESFVLRLLRVPPMPSAPWGSRDARVFRAAPNYWKLSLARWIITQVSALGGLVFGLFLVEAVVPRIGQEGFLRMAQAAEIFGWLLFIVQLPFTYAMLRFDYQMRWYIVADRSLRIREGLVRVNEKTMTFANIQNISIRQGPLQKLLGIADLEVRSAGGGSGGAGAEGQQKHVREELHVGYFRGVSNAAEIRDILREGVRRHRDTGLGDPDEKLVLEGDDRAIAAARRVLEEARALRAALR